MLFHKPEKLHSCWINMVKKISSQVLSNLSTNTTWYLQPFQVLTGQLTSKAFKLMHLVSQLNHGLPLGAIIITALSMGSLTRQLKQILLLWIICPQLKLWRQMLLAIAKATCFHVPFGVTKVGNSIPPIGALNLHGKLTCETKTPLLVTFKSTRAMANTHGQVLPLCSQPPLPSMPPRPWPSECKLRINGWFGHQKTKD